MRHIRKRAKITLQDDRDTSVTNIISRTKDGIDAVPTPILFISQKNTDL